MHKNDDGRDVLVVKKDELIKALNENRFAHRAEFEKALAGWEKKVLEVLKERLAEAKKGIKRAVYIQLPMPEDHTRDYDRRIRMYEMDIEDTVELSEQEFAMYVQDDWGWKQQWTTSNAVYLAQQD